jgi:hypothetical protein
MIQYYCTKEYRVDYATYVSVWCANAKRELDSSGSCTADTHTHKSASSTGTSRQQQNTLKARQKLSNYLHTMQATAMDFIAVNNNAVDLMRQGSFQERGHPLVPFGSPRTASHCRVQKQNMNMTPSSTTLSLGDTLSSLKLSIYQDQDAFFHL